MMRAGIVSICLLMSFAGPASGQVISARPVEYSNRDYGFRLPLPANIRMCDFVDGGSQRSVDFVSSDFDDCQTIVPQRFRLTIWANASFAGTADDVPPIRLEIARSKCRHVSPAATATGSRRVTAGRLRDTGVRIAGLAAYECRRAYMREQVIEAFSLEFIFFRGNALRRSPNWLPYPEYEYNIGVTAPPTHFAEAERLLREMVMGVRLLPLR